uniref:Uncharacterized protein n=1 Tax=Setaria digitata TaxID=48799 RepID=A0A915PVV9_9BILA
MTSSTSTRSTFSGLSECCLSEAGSSGLQNRSGIDESQEECPKCAAMRLNAIIAEEALASLSGQFKNLQKELKKTEQVSKINEEQAKYIDERRSKLEKLEAERTALYADYENLRISHDSLKRQYDEVVATARRNQRLVEESVKYHETCKVAMENLMAEKEARQELLSKYLKSVEAAAKINDSMKQLEKKCIQLQAANEKLEPFKYHCPPLLRLLLEFGEIIENNGLMTKSLQKRLAKYKDSNDLRDYLLRKTRRMKNASESSAKTIEGSSDDDELAKGVEDLLLTSNTPHLKSPKKGVSPNKEIKNFVDGEGIINSTNSTKEILSVKTVDKDHDFLKKQSKNVEAVRIPIQKSRFKSNIYEEKTLRERQLELIERQKKKLLHIEVEKVTFDSDVDVCTASNSASSFTKNSKEFIKRDKEQHENGLQNIFGDVLCENKPKFTDAKENGRLSKAVDQNSERKHFCSNERLSTWLSFTRLEPLLPKLNKPKFLDTEVSRLASQHISDDGMDNLFGPLSPMSSRRASWSSTESCAVLESSIGSRSLVSCAADAVLAPEEISCFAGLSSHVSDSNCLTKCPLEASTTSISMSFDICSETASATVTLIRYERMITKDDAFFSIRLSEQETIPAKIHSHRNIYEKEGDAECLQNLKVSDSSEQASVPIDSKYGLILRTENEYKSLGIRFGLPKLPRPVIDKLTNIKGKELEENRDSLIQRPESAEIVPEKITFNKKGFTKEENLVRLPADKVRTVASKVIQEEQESGKCTTNSVFEEQLVRRSTRRREQVRIYSCSSEDSEKLVLDAEESNSVQDDVTIKATEQEGVSATRNVLGDQILSNDVAGRMAEIVGNGNLGSWKKSHRKNSSEDDEQNSKKYEAVIIKKPSDQFAHKNQNNSRLVTARIQSERLKNDSSSVATTDTESSPKNIPVKKSEKLCLTPKILQVVCEIRKQEPTEGEFNKVEDEQENVGEVMVPRQELNTPAIHCERESMIEDREVVSKSKPSRVRLIGKELMDLDDDDNRLEIVTDDVALSVNTRSTPDGSSVSNSYDESKKSTKTTVAVKKSISAVKSEMYKKMQKRLAIQTSCMKELGRLQIRKHPMENTIIPTVSKLKKVERKPVVMQRKRRAVMLPLRREVMKRAKNIEASPFQHSAALIGVSSAKVSVGSDEAAVMCLFDQALSESNYNDKLLEIVQKFQASTISAISCEKLAEYCVKFISKLDVGNMWHSVVLAVRYWSNNQKGHYGNGKILELHQVASSKERNFIEVLHQLSGEEHWSDDGSNDETLVLVKNFLKHLIERDSSDRVVPMVCYAVAIVPKIVDELLLDGNEQYEPMRRVMSVHLASRDELFTIFNKVIMSRLLNKTTYSATCVRKLDADNFHDWFAESINMVITDTNGLDLDSMEMSPRLSSAVLQCCALFSIAPKRLIPDKEALVFPVLNECVRMISHRFENEGKERDEIFVDTTQLQSLSQDLLVKTILRLILFGRLIASLVRSSECCLLPQLAKLVEEVHKFREFTRIKFEQEGGTIENRLLYFGLNDWLRVVKPFTTYLHSAFQTEKTESVATPIV